MREDPPADFRCKDKFLVQSIAITPEFDSVALPDLWLQVEKEHKDKIHEHKLRTVYLMPTEDSLMRESSISLVPSAVNQSAVSDAGTAFTAAGDGGAKYELERANETIRQLKGENERKAKELDALRADLRKRGSEGDKVGMRTKQAGQDAVQVPVHTVLIVAVLAFMIGYWFF
jgi:hypothetical protein